jgi:hypothetical protein
MTAILWDVKPVSNPSFDDITFYLTELINHYNVHQKGGD